MKETMDFKDGDYLVVSHDDEEVRFDVFKTLEEVYKWIEEQYELCDDVDVDEEFFRKFFDDSFVDGDSYSAYNLLRYKDGKFELIHGLVEFRGYYFDKE